MWHCGRESCWSTLRSAAQVRVPYLVELHLHVQKVKAEDEREQHRDQWAGAATGSPGALLHRRDAAGRAPDCHEWWHDEDDTGKQRQHRARRPDGRVIEEAPGLVVDLVPPDEVVDPQRDDLQTDPDCEGIAELVAAVAEDHGRRAPPLAEGAVAV